MEYKKFRNIGRNDPCPCKSGRKYKHCCFGKIRPKAKWKIHSVFLIAILLVMGIGIYFWLRPSATQDNAKQSHVYSRAIVQYFSEKPDDTCWMVSPSEYFQDTGSVAEKLIFKKKEIENIVSQYKTALPLAQEIQTAFPKFYTSLFVKNASVSILSSGETIDGSLEICFISREDMAYHPSALYYRSDWRSLMVFALPWPGKLYPAIIFHELGHSLRHKEGKISSISPPGSKEYILEEYEMHKLEFEILQATTSQEYGRLIDDIVKRIRAKSYKEIIEKLSFDDVKKMDTILGLESSGARVCNIAIGQFVVDLIIKTIEVTAPPESREEKFIEAYQWLKKNF